MRSFTGFTNCYQKFVPNYAIIGAPISSLLRKEVELVYGNAQQKAFYTVIQRLAHSTTLAYQDKDKTIRVHTDASDVAMGATLSQVDDNGEMRLVACMSKR